MERSGILWDGTGSLGAQSMAALWNVTGGAKRLDQPARRPFGGPLGGDGTPQHAPSGTLAEIEANLPIVNYPFGHGRSFLGAPTWCRRPAACARAPCKGLESGQQRAVTHHSFLTSGPAPASFPSPLLPTLCPARRSSVLRDASLNRPVQTTAHGARRTQTG